MTFPIKKRINIELFIDRTVTLYLVDGDQRWEISESGQPLVLIDLWIDYTVWCKWEKMHASETG